MISYPKKVNFILKFKISEKGKDKKKEHSRKLY